MLVYALVFASLGTFIGVWTWVDRRHYGYSVLASMLWVLGLGISIPSALLLIIMAFRWLTGL